MADVLVIELVFFCDVKCFLSEQKFYEFITDNWKNYFEKLTRTVVQGYWFILRKVSWWL